MFISPLPWEVFSGTGKGNTLSHPSLLALTLSRKDKYLIIKFDLEGHVMIVVPMCWRDFGGRQLNVRSVNHHVGLLCHVAFMSPVI